MHPSIDKRLSALETKNGAQSSHVLAFIKFIPPGNPTPTVIGTLPSPPLFPEAIDMLPGEGLNEFEGRLSALAANRSGFVLLRNKPSSEVRA